jgi:hypothetical protein
MKEKAFQLDLSEFVKQAGLNIETAVRRVGFDVLDKAKANTRVDTGRLRGSWNITEEVVDQSVLSEAPNQKKNYYGPESQNAVGYISGRGEVYITNNVEYGPFIDLKDNIVDLTVAQVEAEINATLRELEKG